MTLPVMPPDPALNQPHLVVDKERRRSPYAAAGRESFDPPPHDEPLLDSFAPVSVDADTGAAVAGLNVIDTVPLSTAISRYSEDS